MVELYDVVEARNVDRTPSRAYPASEGLLDDGRGFRWEGFFTGHRVLGDDEIAKHAADLLGATLHGVTLLAERDLVYRAASRENGSTRALILHSATRTIKCLEGDVDDMLSGRVPRDMATFLETRSVYLGSSNDVVIGRTAPWLEATRVFEVPGIDVGKLDFYYLSQALLELAKAHTSGAVTPVAEIVAWLRRNPGAMVRLYSLDIEAQIFLVWLLRETGLESMEVEANSPEVDASWNQKGHLHLTVDRARSIQVKGLSAVDCLRAEQHGNTVHRRIELEIPVFPGYTIERAGVTRPHFTAAVLTAAALLQERYEISMAALKPSQSGEGARIIGNVALADTDELRNLAEQAYTYGDDYLLEAWIDFIEFYGGGAQNPVVPSGHFRHGHVADELTLQTLDGYRWTGNVIVDGPAWSRLGLPLHLYEVVRGALNSAYAAFSEPAVGGHGRRIVAGGIDFGIGRIGGRFGDEVTAGALDFNFSANGAEYVRTFHDRVRAASGGSHFAATRVFRPARTASLTETLSAVRSEFRAVEHVAVVACVPGRWGMIAASGTDPRSAMEIIEHVMGVLRERGLVLQL